MTAPSSRGLTVDDVRRIAASLPGVDESTSYGTPAWRVRRTLLARIHEDGDSLVLRTDFDTRDFLLRHRPEVFHVTEHYRNYPFVLVRLAAASAAELREHLEATWRRFAPKPLVAEYESG